MESPVGCLKNSQSAVGVGGSTDAVPHARPSTMGTTVFADPQRGPDKDAASPGGGGEPGTPHSSETGGSDGERREPDRLADLPEPGRLADPEAPRRGAGVRITESFAT